MTSGRLFILGLLLFGLAAGLAALAVPSLRALPVPALTWPLIVGLVAELAMMPRVRDGRLTPITMTERAIGVIGAALVITIFLALAPA